MTIELTYLTLSLILAGSLWIPFIVGVNTVGTGDHNPFERPPELRDMPAWIHRANRAHLNMIETLLPFAGLVLIAHVLSVSTWVTVWATAAFFWLRVAHAVGMISGTAQMPVRPILFTLSWLCSVAIGVQLLLI